ncbi:MAG: hypothetical protein Q4C74_04365 [Rothia sp. (in: high G+C Gram-positive bacteria)]|nr:hypothetical protein [Rothia sp. (in: high G+C Gram-positive bacteria)]
MFSHHRRNQLLATAFTLAALNLTNLPAANATDFTAVRISSGSICGETSISYTDEPNIFEASSTGACLVKLTPVENPADLEFDLDFRAEKIQGFVLENISEGSLYQWEITTRNGTVMNTGFFYT